MTQHPDNSVGAEELREMVVTVLSELDEMANLASVPMELWDRFSNNVIGLCVEAGALALLSTSEAWKPPEGFVVAGWQYRRPQEYLDRHPSASEWVYALQVTEKGAREASYGGFKGRPLNIVRPLFAAHDQPSHTKEG